MSKVAIVGGGIIGLMSAYYLSKHKYEITIIDNTDLESTCSVGNAGLIVPSHFIPIAAPGIISKSIKWFFNPESPVGITKPLNLELLFWLWRFFRNSNQNHVDKSEKPLLNINLLSKELYKDLYRDDEFDFEYQEKGVMNLCLTEKAANEEINLAEKAIRLGLKVQVFNQKELPAVEKCKVNAIAGILYNSDAHLTPNKLIEQLIQYLKRQNVKFRTETEVTGFQCNENKIKYINFQDRCQEVSEVVLAAGSFSGKLAKQLRLKLPVQSGKGYSITINKASVKPAFPSLLIETRTAVTPMGLNLRLTGAMEIGMQNKNINHQKIRSILKSVSKYYPEIKINIPDDKDIWVGCRPLSVDGLPFIGRSKKIDNLTIATGHSMMGLSLGPATGKIVEEIICGKKNSIDIEAFDPNRYG